MVYPITSIVIPTYNRAHLISRAIHSVIAQTYSDFELIIIDDCSTDDTKAVIKGFNDSRIKYIFQTQNLGVNIARNTGIAAAQGEYIAFLDSDDEWLPDKLEKQLRILQNSNTDVAACYTWIKSIHEITLKEKIIAPTSEGFIFEDLLYSCFTNTSSMVIKREYVQAIGGFDSNPSFRSCQDWDLWLRLARQYKFVVVPEVLSIFWNHDSANRNTNNYRRMLDGYLALLKKHPEMQDLPNTFNVTGSIPLEKKAHYFFERGKRYMNQAILVDHDEGIKLGKIYLKAAFSAYPNNSEYFIHYLFSYCFGKKYILCIQIEHHLRKQARKIFKDSKEKL